jgi:hypothetical protein
VPNIIFWKPLHFDPALVKAGFYRADLKLSEVKHAGASFEARVFLNNTAANEDTPTVRQAGYAGSFYVFGHGGCFGDEGHCDIPITKRPFDFRPPHPLTPITKYVTITDPLKDALAISNEVTVTIVSIVKAKTANDKFNTEDVLRFKSLEIITYAS